MSEQSSGSIRQTANRPAAASDKVRRSESRGLRVYMLAVTLAGGLVVLYSLPAAVARLDAVLLTLCALTVLAGPLAVRFRLPGRTAGGLAVTVSDCFTFLGLILAGPGAAVLLAALDAATATFGMLIRKPGRCLFNIGQMSVAAFAAAHVYAAWGSDRSAGLATTALSLALCASLYFILSDALVAIAIGMSTQQSIAGLFAQLSGKLIPAFALIAAAALAATAALPLVAALLAALVLLALARHLLKRLDPKQLAA